MPSGVAMLQQLLQGQAIFQQETLDAIINELPIPETKLRLTKAFLPTKSVDEDELLIPITHAIGGLMGPVKRTTQHQVISLPGMHYRQMAFGFWRESMVFDEDELLKIKNPRDPKKVWGEDMVAQGLNVLDLRLMNRMEWCTAQVLMTGGYTIAENGVNYTANFGISERHLLDITNAATFNAKPYAKAAKWTTGGAWTDTANSLPLDDVLGCVSLMALSGLLVDEIWMTSVGAKWIEGSDSVTAMIQANPDLARSYLRTDKIVKVLGGLKSVAIQIYDDIYPETQVISTPIAAGGTTLVMEDASKFNNGDVVMLVNASDQREDVELSSKSGNQFTIGATTYAYAKGDRCFKTQKFLADNYVLFKGHVDERQTRGNWLITPSIVGGSIAQPKKDKYTWSYIHDRPPIFVEVGAGINGGPAIYAPFWTSVKVAA